MGCALSRSGRSAASTSCCRGVGSAACAGQGCTVGAPLAVACEQVEGRTAFSQVPASEVLAQIIFSGKPVAILRPRPWPLEIMCSNTESHWSSTSSLLEAFEFPNTHVNQERLIWRASVSFLDVASTHISKGFRAQSKIKVYLDIHDLVPTPANAGSTTFGPQLISHLRKRTARHLAGLLPTLRPLVVTCVREALFAHGRQSSHLDYGMQRLDRS